MKTLDLYLYANLYILFFWVFYRIFLNRSAHFKGNRIFIISALTLSLCLPFLQIKISSLLASPEGINPALRTININYIREGFTSFTLGTSNISSNVNWSQIIILIILIGILISLSNIIFSHFRIKALIKRSKPISENQNKVFLCNEEIAPFIYNDVIIIPESAAASDREIIIKHERLHYILGHHYDNYLLQFFQIVFWINPLLYLIKNELKLIHEYQVDQELISKGTDSVQYKLALVKFKAGYQKFAISNGLNTNLKNRLNMINSNPNPKGKWRVLLSIPALFFLFLAFSFSCITPTEESAVKPSTPIQAMDSVDVKLISIPDGFEIKDPREAVVVLINKSSDVAIEGKFAPEGKRESMIIHQYDKLREERFFNNLTPKVKIIVQKDQNTPQDDFESLLDEISMAINTMHENWAKRNYNKSFQELKKEEQQIILEMVPPEIYYAPPKKVSVKR